MFDKSILQKILNVYKKDFRELTWPNEKFKWVAVKMFQDNWNVNAADFTSMLEKSFSSTENLLVSNNYYPGKMILEFSKKFPEEVRAMFINLYDESKDLISRIEDFKIQATALLEKRYTDGIKRVHYQTENSISTYLWLKYPDKYYIYKYKEVSTVSKVLGSSFKIKKGLYSENLRNCFSLYNEICDELKKDEELNKMLKESIDDSCYQDLELKTLTIDIGHYISNKYGKSSKIKKSEWEFKDYSPNLSTKDWINLLNDKTIFNETSLEIMNRFKDIGGVASCSQLSIKYGETSNFYNSGSTFLAKRIVEKTNCPVYQGKEENSRWWPILYLGKKANKDEIGVYIWKLRPELSKALDTFDFTNVKLYATSKIKNGEKNYWWLNANPKIWNFSDIKKGETQSYTLYNENGNKRRIFQNFLDIKVGDIIIGYESTPIKQVVAIVKVISEQDGKEFFFEKIESLENPIDYQTLKDCSDLEQMEYFKNAQGSLFKLTKDEFDFIYDMIREANPLSIKETKEIYNKELFLNEVYINENDYDSIVSILDNKNNIILQGPPGIGKTFTAKRLAYSIIGEKNNTQIEFVQFHQNYSYEDFMMGYKPCESGFKLSYGIFYRFCKKAENNPDKKYFFIIDEINRGNLSKIFGELLMLIEKNYRDEKISLAYTDVLFSVPKNIYIIGMMNTADRSLAMIDYALRRRFSFFTFKPGFNSEGFRKYQEELNCETLNTVVELIKSLNREIENDRSLGKGFCIGHSYFCNQKNCNDEWIEAVIKYDIIPMLSEYWFDDSNKLQIWENRLLGLFQ